MQEGRGGQATTARGVIDLSHAQSSTTHRTRAQLLLGVALLLCSRSARRAFSTTSCAFMAAPRPCCTYHPVCHARRWRHSTSDRPT